MDSFRFHRFLARFLIVAAAMKGPVGRAQESVNEPTDLAAAVEGYFKEPDHGKRRQLSSNIEALASGAPAAVAEAIERAQVWAPVEKRNDSVVMIGGDGPAMRIDVSLPPDYDCTKRYPLLFAFPDADGSGDHELDESLLNAAAETHIVATVEDSSYGNFNDTAERSGVFRGWLKTLYRKYHVDADRIILYGSGEGGDRAFLLAAMHPDVLAAVIIREGTLDVPYHEQLHRILLGNLKNTAIHLTWTQPEMPPRAVLAGRSAKVAMFNRSVLDAAEKMRLPIEATILKEPQQPNLDQWKKDLCAIRDSNVRAVTHWFRYPGQGHARFVSADSLTPPIWEGDQLDIMTPATVDREAFVTTTLQSHMASLRARIDGQTIDIQSTHCDAIELRLTGDMLDFTKPVEIILDGNKRYSDVIRPNIRTMLETAYKDWRFQHPIYARVRIGPKGRVMPF